MSYLISSTIGKTPLVQLKRMVPKGSADVYVKLEYFNPTGSYKDRMAQAIVDEAEKRGDLKPGVKVLECTGGSTGTSLAFVCSVKGYPFHVISSDAFAKEKLQSMQLFGAELEIVPSEGGKITPDLIPRMIARAEVLNKSGGFYWTRQFENTDALQGYAVLGQEILTQLTVPVYAFCAAIGTSGLFSGVSRKLKSENSRTLSVGVEPSSAPLISKGVKGSHKVDGVGVGFMPPLLKPSDYDRILAVEESEARDMARRLAKEEGIFTGTSTGLNVVAALQLAKEIGPGPAVVTVACDSGMKYLASGLFD